MRGSGRLFMYLVLPGIVLRGEFLQDAMRFQCQAVIIDFLLSKRYARG